MDVFKLINSNNYSLLVHRSNMGIKFYLILFDFFFLIFAFMKILRGFLFAVYSWQWNYTSSWPCRCHVHDLAYIFLDCWLQKFSNDWQKRIFFWMVLWSFFLIEQFSNWNPSGNAQPKHMRDEIIWIFLKTVIL